MERSCAGWRLLYLLPLLIFSRPAAAQEQPVLLLTEVYYDTPGRDAEEEWVEIANLGTQSVALDGYKVGDAATASSQEGMLAFPPDAQLAADQVIVVAQSAAHFRNRFGWAPDYEIRDSDPAVPDMRTYYLWGQGEFALNNEGDEVLLLDPENRPVDVVNYGRAESFFFPGVSDVVRGQSIARIPAGCDTDSAADWVPLANPSPGSVIREGACRPRPDPEIAGEILPIGTVQGAAPISPYINQVVTIRGIMTGYLADQNADGVTFYTLFIQDEGDNNGQTADGMAVFLATQPPAYVPGDDLLVTGRVIEFFDLTEIDHEDLQIARLSGRNPLPAAVNLTDTTRLEPYEGMRVAIPDSPVTGPTHVGCGFAVLLENVGNGEAPPHLIRRSATEQLAGLMPVLHTTDVDCAGFPQLKVGDRVAGLAGPLIYHFDQFKIVHQDPQQLAITTAPVPQPPAMPVLAETHFSVATFNLENHFDQERAGTEPVIPAAQVASREAQLSRTIGSVLGCPTILGVQEVENARLLVSLAEQVADICGFVYTISHQDSPDARGMDVALLAHPGRVTVQAVVLEQGCTARETAVRDPVGACPAGQFPLHSRPPLRVELLVDGVAYTVYVNHFKSKREGEAETAAWRLAQAEHQNELVQQGLAADPQSRIVVLGDFNDYEQSPPLVALTRPAGALVNALLTIPDEERYSYIFGGAAQLIDGILLSPAMVEQVVQATIVHVNADYPAGWGEAQIDSLYRSADHDIPLLVLAQPLPTPSATASPWPVVSAEPAREVVREPAGMKATDIATTVVQPAAETATNDRPASRLLWLVALLVTVTGGGIYIYLRRSGR
jgi:hypothetical protein